MRDIIRMVIVLAVLSALSGGLLAAVKNGTAAKIEYQQLKFVKGPAIKDVLKGCTNDPLVDRFKIKDGDVERNFYVGVFNDEPRAVAFETFGKGVGGPIGIVAGVDLKTDKLLGVGVTTHKETPGLGARAKTDLKFKEQFKGMPFNEPFKVKQDGGAVDAISGATITSRGICAGLNAADFYRRLKPEIMKKVKAFAK